MTERNLTETEKLLKKLDLIITSIKGKDDPDSN